MDPGAIAQGLRESASDYENAIQTQMLGNLDVEPIRENVDELLSNVGNLVQRQITDPSTLGENRYQMIATIGQGEFSRVFGALKRDDEKLVGIKIPHLTKLASYRHIEQFYDDCKKAQSLDHPRIQEILEFGRWDEHQIFLSKPLIQHPTLTTFAKSNLRLSFPAMLHLFRQAIDTIHYAHQQNVLHRHLNPNNIHVIESSDGSPTESSPVETCQLAISDFGFVFDSRYHFDLVEPSAVKNPFVSPESATLNANYVDERSDVYSLGKILKLLIRITENATDIPGINQVIEKATSTRRRDRYQTVSELKLAFELV
jgi:serine/threonine protein kinase